MNNNIQIRPTVTEIDGQLVEAYERITNAPAEAIEALGLDPEKSHWARIGVASVNEYVRLIATNIPKGERRTWRIADLRQDVEIDSIYIDAPNQDSFDLEVYDKDGRKLLDLTIRRNQAPFDLANAILTQDLTLKIYAREQIDLILINCRPAVLLQDLYSVEDIERDNPSP